MLNYIKSKTKEFWDMIIGFEATQDTRKRKEYLDVDKVKTIEQIYSVYPKMKDTVIAKQYNISVSTARRIRVGEHRYSRRSND